MIAVINASPLIALALADRLHLLQDIFDQVIVPATVYQEVVGQGSNRPGASMIAQASWLQVTSPQTSPVIEVSLLGLDAGEMDLLLLAHELKPDWVVIDERLGRRAARLLGFSVKGTMGILLTATLAGLISQQEALDAMDEMISQGIHISPSLQSWLRKELSSSEI